MNRFEEADPHHSVEPRRPPQGEITERERQYDLAARVVQFIWLLVIGLEILIGIRVLLRLLGANPEVAFASLIYQITDLFLLPFMGLTVAPEAGGLVLDIPALIAMVVYAAFGWLMVRLIWLLVKPA
jgi:hypothetical protein